MLKLHLQCTLDRLGPDYESGKPYYALTLSAGLEGDVTPKDVESILQPWNWKAIDTLRVVGQPSDGSQPWAALAHRVLPATAVTHADRLRDAFTAELAEQLKEFHAEEFTWTPATKTSASGIDEHTVTVPRRRDWRAFLAQQSTLPGGLAMHIQLSVVFALDADPGATTNVLAVPVLSGDGFGTIVPDDPNTNKNLDAVTGTPNLFRWKYTTATLNEVDAYVNVPPPITNNPKSLINRETLFRNVNDVPPPGDWLAQLQPVVAAAFDLPERALERLRPKRRLLVRWHRDGCTTLPKSFELVDATFTTLFYDALYDFVRPAVELDRLPPDGVHLTDHVLFAPSTVASRSDFTLPANKPAKWRDLVAEAIGTVVASAPSLPLAPDPPAAAEDPAVYLAGLADYVEALSFVQEQMRGDALVAELVVQLWHGAYHPTGADRWAEIEPKVRTGLQSERLRSRLLLHNAGAAWRSLFEEAVDVGTELAHVRTAVTATLVDRARTLVDPVPADWSKRLTRTVTRLVTRALAQLTSDPTSDGVTIQFDRPAQKGATGGDVDRQDYLRQILGAGVLLRQNDNGAQPWRCLNLARLDVIAADDIGRVQNEAAEEPHTNVYAPVDDQPMVMPVRFQYPDGLRAPFRTYVNQPLVARSPWSRLTPTREMQPDEESSAPGLLRYESPYSINGTWQLERIVYGHRYDYSVFYFGNVGNLPKQLATQDGNGLPIPWQLALPDANAAIPHATVDYRRQSALGLFRLAALPSNAGGPTAPAHALPPPLPDHVYPLTRVAAQGGEVDDPLIVLRPPDDDLDFWNDAAPPSFAVAVRPPSLNEKIWDRWIENDPPNTTLLREQRKAVIGDVHVIRAGLDSKTLVDGDSTLDDPSVAGFEVRLVPIVRRTSTGPSNQHPQVLFAARNEKGILREQKIARVVTVESTAAKDIAVAATADGVKISVPKGEAWRIDLVPIVSKTDRDRFSTTAQALLDDPTSFHVEVAARLVEGSLKQRADELYRALAIGHTLANGKAVAIDLTTAPVHDWIGGAHRVELIAQRWRWDGRPVYQLEEHGEAVTPLVSGMPFKRFDLDETFAGDGLLFQSRDESDYVVVPKQIDVPDPAVVTTTPIHAFEIETLRGVLYYRVALTVFSRYEGLMRQPQSVCTWGAPGASSHVKRWKRHVVPCRWLERVPVPSVKLVVPLTRALGKGDAAEAVPGWLVVLNDEWYRDSMGGLGEQLTSEIVDVGLPDRPDERRHQFGPDPVIDMRPDPYADFDVKLPQPTGAIGFTFDTDTSAPLFIHSSFVQRPPTVRATDESTSAGPIDLTFHFVKIRFRRELAGTDAKKPQDVGLSSDWTEARWTQILPPANRWRVKVCPTAQPCTVLDDIVDVDALAYVADRGTIERRGTAVWPAATAVPPGLQKAATTPPSMSRFEVFGLLTRVVVDAFGRRDQESFAAIVPIEHLGLVPAGTRSGARLRLVEVQFRRKPDAPLPGNLADLVADLFTDTSVFADGKVAPRDAGARIVRVSPPLTNK